MYSMYMYTCIQTFKFSGMDNKIELIFNTHFPETLAIVYLERVPNGYVDFAHIWNICVF